MSVALVLLQFIPFAIVLVLANLEEQNSAFRWLTYIALTLLNVLFIMMGLVGLLASAVDLSTLPAEVMTAEAAAASMASLQALGLVGLLGFLPFLRPVRALLARLIPINPDSTVHMTALVYAIYLLGIGIGQQPLLTDADVLGELDLQITSGLVWAQGLGMAIIALPGVGAFIRRNWQETLERFGIKTVSLRDLGIALVAIFGLFILQIAVTLLWQALDPVGFSQIDNANSLLLGELSGLGAAFAIGLSAAIGEELVFRGALQPRFGLVLTALLFTIVHSQYGFSPATLLILGIALVLGVLRNRTSLSVCILVHFGYNFLSVMLASVVQGQF